MTPTARLRIEVIETADGVANKAAAVIAEEARQAVDARGRFLVAVSGGRTPWAMLRILATINLPWHAVQVFQVDERVAPLDHPDRNLLHLRESLLDHAPLEAAQIHGMPVESADPWASAVAYSGVLQTLAGEPPVLDLIHLGLGSDGHTASLVPGDGVLDVQETDVAATDIYEGRHRVTLTFPMINRARRVLWVVTGGEKAGALRQLLDGDLAIPAARVRRECALVVADKAAAAKLAE